MTSLLSSYTQDHFPQNYFGLYLVSIRPLDDFFDSSRNENVAFLINQAVCGSELLGAFVTLDGFEFSGVFQQFLKPREPISVTQRAFVFHFIYC